MNVEEEGVRIARAGGNQIHRLRVMKPADCVVPHVHVLLVNEGTALLDHRTQDVDRGCILHVSKRENFQYFTDSVENTCESGEGSAHGAVVAAFRGLEQVPQRFGVAREVHPLILRWSHELVVRLDEKHFELLEFLGLGHHGSSSRHRFP
jgi:hypothetical protein